VGTKDKECHRRERAKAERNGRVSGEISKREKIEKIEEKEWGQ
jgi:hypothetical protein